jgi:hypothetical protein
MRFFCLVWKSFLQLPCVAYPHGRNKVLSVISALVLYMVLKEASLALTAYRGEIS